MIFGDVVVGDTGQPERWRDVAGVAITTFPIVSRFLDIKEAKPVLDTVVELDLRRSWPFGGHGPCRIQPSTMCDDQKTLADCGPYKVAPDNIWPCTISNVSYFLEKERALKDSRPRKKKI
jgi:hypothetical protein